MEMKGPAEKELVLDILKKAFASTRLVIETTLPKTREVSLAITNLEQAELWARKAVDTCF